MFILALLEMYPWWIVLLIVAALVLLGACVFAWAINGFIDLLR